MASILFITWCTIDNMQSSAVWKIFHVMKLYMTIARESRNQIV